MLIIDCEYGDKIRGCTKSACDNPDFKQQCCYTCALAQTERLPQKLTTIPSDQFKSESQSTFNQRSQSRGTSSLDSQQQKQISSFAISKQNIGIPVTLPQTLHTNQPNEQPNTPNHSSKQQQHIPQGSTRGNRENLQTTSGSGREALKTSSGTGIDLQSSSGSNRDNYCFQPDARYFSVYCKWIKTFISDICSNLLFKYKCCSRCFKKPTPQEPPPSGSNGKHISYFHCSVILSFPLTLHVIKHFAITPFYF